MGSEKRQYVVYIAGPYTADGPEAIQKNIDAAEQVSIQLLQRGYSVICPHKNTGHLDHVMPWEEFIEMGLTLLDRCDAALFIPGWEHSRGCRIEHEYCETQGIPFFESIEALEKHFESKPLPYFLIDED